MGLIYFPTRTEKKPTGFWTICHYCGEAIRWALRDLRCPACGHERPAVDDEAAIIDELLADTVEALERAA